MLDIFKVFSNESKTSKSVAKERLKLVLVHDRVDCSPQLLDLIKTDILKVIANYAEIEEDGLEIKMRDGKYVSFSIYNSYKIKQNTEFIAKYIENKCNERN